MAKNIMFVGTNSSAGKSFFVTAMCRVLSDLKYKVSPFKSQNMALNSYVDENNLEFGRAQALQAFAGRIMPDARMNPILLKPRTDKKSDVILLGKKTDTYDAKQYYKIKSKYLPYIKKAYQELSNISDIIVLEGAGSPAEINLLDGDFVNMGMAEMVDAPVILVADIDKGGVFASIYGTIMLTPEKWRKYYKGVIINKFRGQKEILKSGIQEIEKLTKVPVISVMPYIDVEIEEEDSLTNKLKLYSYDKDKINITIIKLPNLSNFTEFSPLTLFQDVNVNYITIRDDIPTNTDILIIPSSKNIFKDLEEIVKVGFDEKLKSYAEYKNILAIGNAVELLAKNIYDIQSIYSDKKDKKALGLLDIDISTVQSFSEKINVKIINKQGLLQNSQDEINLYRIKTGEIKISKIEDINKFSDNTQITMKFENEVISVQKRNILGIYAFGVFENTKFINNILNDLRIKKSIKPIDVHLDYNAYREKQICKLADEFNKYIDIKKLMDIIESGV
ncbi:cobyric acid synthase CobQ [Peptoanaerobacter stomatis]|uniref:Cobyric acid synthase n=1 Tax=Peptoanaerobacter stomatis TaxID=796937 RepID=G9X001_9FIRM|nr:cobyric acid synthase [Peptoanaerobacter stomatis]EHL15633.1 cobyric acid synthase CobQ [Peptoanaerobacter stomatis]